MTLKYTINNPLIKPQKLNLEWVCSINGYLVCPTSVSISKFQYLYMVHQTSIYINQLLLSFLFNNYQRISSFKGYPICLITITHAHQLPSVSFITYTPNKRIIKNTIHNCPLQISKRGNYCLLLEKEGNETMRRATSIKKKLISFLSSLILSAGDYYS